jgi:VWFA-related protein
MNGRPFLILTLAAVALSIGLSAGDQNPFQQPVFRAGTLLVPVDVRVLDRNGKPITTLTQADFQILENGVRQQIQHFSIESLKPEPPAGGMAPLVRAAASNEIKPQNHRVFLIVLGRGRLQYPARGMDGVIKLVRERLLPQDYIAVLAWNRATDFTTDHAAVLSLLQRFKDRHERIELLLRQQFSGLAAVYGGTQIPQQLQANIDDVFYGAEGGPGVRTLPNAPAASAGRTADDLRRAADALQRNEILSTRTGASLTDAVDPAAGLDMSFEAFASMTADSMQDLAKIYAGIEYLRHVNGEKHLLFVSESGIFLPRAEDDHGLAARASDARVAIDVIHTGGMAPANLTGTATFDWRTSTSQTVAEQTGGSFTRTSYATDFVDRLDVATRFQYVLGYYPSNTTLDGKLRRIMVRVLNHPGATVQFRHGYFASGTLEPINRDRVLSYSRVTAAANAVQAVPDLELAVTATQRAINTTSREVSVQIRISPDRLGFTEADGRKKGRLDVAIFCADDRERLVGQSWNAVELEMTPDAYIRFQRNGLTYTTKVPVRVFATYVKVVVYDTAADLLGSAIVKIK